MSEELIRRLRDEPTNEEYQHGRGHFPTEDDGGHANVEVLQALCPNPGATALESVVWAADQIESLEIFRRDAKVENAELHSQIESLQRENGELRTDRDNWKGLKRKASQAAERLEQENAELRAKQMTAAAITPEMREKIEAILLPESNAPWRDGNSWTQRANAIFRDLLGEHGGMGDE